MTAAADKARDGVAELEAEIARLKREITAAKARPPFERYEADVICRELHDVLTGRTAIPADTRRWRFAIPTRTHVVGRWDGREPMGFSPSYREIEVRW